MVAILVLLSPKVAMVAVGTPKKLGLMLSTLRPVPVVPVAPVPPFSGGRLPVTPVVRGKPVQFVNVPDVGVPKAGLVSVGLFIVGLVSVLLVRVWVPVSVTTVESMAMVV